MASEKSFTYFLHEFLLFWRIVFRIIAVVLLKSVFIQSISKVIETNFCKIWLSLCFLFNFLNLVFNRFNLILKLCFMLICFDNSLVHQGTVFFCGLNDVIGIHLLDAFIIKSVKSEFISSWLLSLWNGEIFSVILVYLFQLALSKLYFGIWGGLSLSRREIMIG